jgi:hypothetical protein
MCWSDVEADPYLFWPYLFGATAVPPRGAEGAFDTAANRPHLPGLPRGALPEGLRYREMPVQPVGR